MRKARKYCDNKVGSCPYRSHGKRAPECNLKNDMTCPYPATKMTLHGPLDIFVPKKVYA